MNAQPASAADDVLLARAVALGRIPDAEQDDDEVALLLLGVSGQRIAVPVQDVAEVRRPGPLSQVPGAGGALAGLVGGQGVALAVASLATLLGIRTSVPPHEQWVAVLHDPAAPLGLLADAAEDIVQVPRHALVAPADSSSLVGAVLDDGTLVLRTDVLLRDPRLSLTAPQPAEEPAWPER